MATDLQTLTTILTTAAREIRTEAAHADTCDGWTCATTCPVPIPVPTGPEEWAQAVLDSEWLADLLAAARAEGPAAPEGREDLTPVPPAATPTSAPVEEPPF